MKDKYLAEAVFVSRRSKDPSTQVGAVIVDQFGHPVSNGYNGPPANFDSDEWFTKTRERKNAATIHAEINAILFARGQVRGADLYVWPLPPCSHCAPIVRQSGIKRIFASDMMNMKAETRDRLWHACNLKLAAKMYGNAVELILVPADKWLEAYKRCELPW